MSVDRTTIIPVGDQATRALAKAGFERAPETAAESASGRLLVVAVDCTDEDMLPFAEQLARRAHLAGAAAVLAVRTPSFALTALRQRADRLGVAIIVNATPDIDIAELCRALVEPTDVPGLIGYPSDAMHGLCAAHAVGVVHRWIPPLHLDDSIETPPGLVSALSRATTVHLLVRAPADVTLFDVNAIALAIQRNSQLEEATLVFAAIIIEITSLQVLLTLFE